MPNQQYSLDFDNNVNNDIETNLSVDKCIITTEKMIQFLLSEEEIKNIIIKAKDNNLISQRDNLRNRHPNIQFDCILRGYIGEYAVKKWFNFNGIEISTNQLLLGENMDIDFLYKDKNIELKTSLIPDADITIDNVILNRDIKLIKRENKIEDLKGDIHAQIYFNQRRKAKDDWLRQQEINLNSNDVNYLFDKIGADRYEKDTFLISWIDKPTLINKINSMEESERTWSFGSSKREFWKCKINDCRKPIELIEYLKKLN